MKYNIRYSRIDKKNPFLDCISAQTFLDSFNKFMNKSIKDTATIYFAIKLSLLVYKPQTFLHFWHEAIV